MRRLKPSVCFVALNAYPLLAGRDDIPFAGGAELQQVLIARGLAQRGYRVSMVCLDVGQDDGARIDGIEVLRAYRSDSGLPGLRFFWPRLFKMWRCLRRADADLYYQRAGGMATGIVAAFCLRHRKRFVFAAAGQPKLNAASFLHYRRDRYLYEYGVRHADRVVVQNAEQERHFRAAFGRGSVRIPNCCEVPETKSAGAARYVLWVSTIREVKRPDMFLELARALPDQRFRMVGGPSTDPRLFEAIKRKAVALDNVEFAGFVPPSKVGDQFDGASVLINTSESEGFPNAFLQAWARGVPSISFVDCGAVFEGKPIGTVVNSLEEMAAAIAKLAAAENERVAEGNRAREYVLKNHSTDHVLDLFERMADELVRQM